MKTIAMNALLIINTVSAKYHQPQELVVSLIQLITIANQKHAPHNQHQIMLKQHIVSQSSRANAEAAYNFLQQ
jgi:hypothetical protein